MKSTVMFQNIEHLFFGLGSWLRRISLFLSFRTGFRDALEGQLNHDELRKRFYVEV